MPNRSLPEMWELIGVSAFDHQVYRRLLTDPLATAALHGDALGCTTGKVRGAVSRLASLGLLRRSTDSPVGYKAVEPSAGLGALVHETRGALDRIEAASRDLSRAFAAGQLRTDPQGLFDMVEGREATAARIHDLLGMARQEAVGIDAPPYIAAGSSQVSDAELGLLRRGVRFRALYASEVLDEPSLAARIHWMAEQGEQSRVLPTVPMKLLIVDRAMAIMPVTDGNDGQSLTSVVVARSALTDGLQATFELLWRNASPIRLNSRAQSNLGDLEPAQAQLLDLLAAGMKDDSIARYLGISVRTLRRRVADLLDGLDATGRFQAGVLAAKRHWI